MGGNSLPFRRIATALTALLSVALISSAAQAQTAVFSGKVTSTTGQPLGGASVGIPDLGVGGIADANGNYTFTVDVAGKTGRTANVMARYIGYKPKRLPITLSEGRVPHDFVLEKDILNLEEVVVTGTSEATSKKKATFSVGVVDNSQMKEVPSTSPLGAIEGKIPGASLITTSGQPGSSPAIRLRSATSLTGRQDPLVIIDGTISNISLADMNSEDIERIEIIKGAAASSLFGSNAANGVVQIFTKRGASLAEGQTSFTIRNEFGSNYLPKVIEGNMHHPYSLLANGQYDLTSGTRTNKADGIADNKYPIYYDQLRKVFRPGQFLTNYVSVGQRRGTTNFNASFQNQHDAGVLTALHGFSRQNFRLNVDQALTEKIDLGMGAFYGRSHADQGEDYSIFFGLRFIEPDAKLDSIVNCGTCPYNGAYNPLIKQEPLSGNVVNPLYSLTQRNVTNDRDRFTGTFKTTYRPLTWLTGEANVGYDEANRNYRYFTPIGFSNSAGITGEGYLQHRSDADRSYNTNLGLTSVRSFWNDQIRNTTKAAFIYEDQEDAFVNVNATALTVTGITEFGAAKQSQNSPVQPSSATETIRAKNAFLVSTFDIKDRYIIDGLVRQDQSSLFGADERTAVYHRLSGAWRLTEDFAIPGVDELKLRASHGTAGLRPPFTAQYETYRVSGGLPSPVNLGNRALKPAFSRESEYGFNLNFLTNYSLEYSYSEKTTTDQIMKVDLSAAAGGYQKQWQNAGALKGHTHEAAFSAVLLSKADYFWRFNVTGDRTRQRISDLKVGAFLIGPFETSENAQFFKIAKGAPFGVIYGDRWIKSEAQLSETIAAGRLTGTVADYTKNEEGFYVRNSQYHMATEVPLKAFVCTATTGSTCTASTSTVQIGDVNPDFTLGFNTTAQWKGASLNATLSWVKGGNIYNYTRQWPFNELRDKVIDQSGKPATSCPASWPTTDPTCPYATGKKPTSYYSSFYNNFAGNDYFVEKGSYARLRELALNYTLPSKWAARIPAADFRTARIGLVGRNLWTNTKYTGYDPDVTAPGGGNPFAYRVDYFTYPAYRTFTAMLELGF
jgi:TonB-linked SusC/RagA family outer membrane protein